MQNDRKNAIVELHNATINRPRTLAYFDSQGNLSPDLRECLEKQLAAVDARYANEFGRLAQKTKQIAKDVETTKTEFMAAQERHSKARNALFSTTSEMDGISHRLIQDKKRTRADFIRSILELEKAETAKTETAAEIRKRLKSSYQIEV